MKKCHNCYAYNEDNAIFCEYCGSNISGKNNYDLLSNSNKEINEKTKNFKELSKKPWAWVILSLIVVIIALILVFCFTSGFSKEYRYKTLAKLAARSLIEEELFSPTSAIWNEVSYVENNEKGQYIIFIDVESKNAFGVYINDKVFVLVQDLDLKNKTYRYSTFCYYVKCSSKYDTQALNNLKIFNNY